MSNLVSCMMDADEEFFALDMRFTTRHAGMEAALQLLHLFVQVGSPIQGTCIVHSSARSAVDEMCA